MRESGFTKAISIEYHRNGIGGVGFWAVLFTMTDNRGKKRTMLATVVPLEDGEKDWNGKVTVLDVNQAAKGNIRFGENSWRGDVYEAELRQAIADHEKERDAKFDAEIAAVREQRRRREASK